jgi:hypothetical protein
VGEDAVDDVGVVVDAELAGHGERSVSAAAIASASLSWPISTSGSTAYVRPKIAWVLASMNPIWSVSWFWRPKYAGFRSSTGAKMLRLTDARGSRS